MRRLALTVAFATATAALPAGLSAASTTGTPSVGRASCDRSSWLAGAVDLCDGRVIYRDYVYDDYGADDPLVPAATRSTTGSLSRPAGDARYPVGQESSADLVRLELRRVGDRLHVTAETSALRKESDTVLAVALDTDDNSKTGGGDWPGVDGVRSAGWESVTVLTTRDAEANTISGTLPLPKRRAFRVQAVTAQGDGTVMNVAFRGTDERATTGNWWEDKQSAALADGDVSDFGHRVVVDDLTRRRTRLADHAAPGFHQRVFTSAYSLGEGMTYDGVPGRHGRTGAVCEQEFHFLGRYQPYGLYVPERKGAKTRPGLQLNLHGCNANHASQVKGAGFRKQFGDDLDRVIVTPLGRGPIGYYSDISERDVLEALADAERTFRPDPGQIHLSGYSMGGYGAYRFAALYPDKWAGMTNWVGFTGDVTNNPVTDDTGRGPSGGIGNVIDLVGNLRHIPSALLYSGADELVHVSSALAMQKRFGEEEVEHEFFLHPYADHLTFALLDDWAKESAWSKGRTRVANPSRVTYRTDPSLAYPEYGIKHDRAYWVSGITGRGEGYVDVDLVTRGCGGSTPSYELGNDAGVGPAAFAWVSSYRERTGSAPLRKAPVLTGSLANAGSATVDATRTCLKGGAVGYDLTVDGPTTLRFSDGRALRLPKAGRYKGELRG